MLEVKNLSKNFGSKRVLQDINLRFEPGKVYGIVGENGAGKTTLFRCISGIESHLGTVTSPYPSLKNHLGYLETTPIFMSYITGWEYLKLLCSAKNINTENFEEQNIFNLPLNQYAETYSTGMKKKLALMGVLLRKNDIFILDEPFNGVDIQSNMLITDIIEELKSLNKTVLISSHIFSTLSSICDEIILLSNGSIQKNVKKEDYEALEQSMKKSVLKKQLKKLVID
ncbi:MAG: ABC transporter ATP-binding protein [Bacteroidetes bacterium]|nr:ABC transporter ATP-binding protein [Bacteroidota bacterium]